MFLEDLQKRFQDMQAKADVRTVFGEPVEIDGRRIIPVASVSYGFGMGGGEGESPADRGDGKSSGRGGGGGGGMRVEPIAYLEVVDGNVKVRPIVNVTRLATMGIALAAWNVFWIARAIRRQKVGADRT